MEEPWVRVVCLHWTYDLITHMPLANLTARISRVPHWPRLADLNIQLSLHPNQLSCFFAKRLLYIEFYYQSIKNARLSTHFGNILCFFVRKNWYSIRFMHCADAFNFGSCIDFLLRKSARPSSERQAINFFSLSTENRGR